MSQFFYNLFWTIAYLLMLPCIFLGKREYFARRFALDLPERKNEEKRIWIHALSIGEVFSSRPLIQAIKKKYPGKAIVLTVKTLQGMKVAEEEVAGEVDGLFFMPLDYRGAISRIINVINPSIFILIETDIWPETLSCLKEKGIKIILINGRVSPRTFRGYKKLRFYFREVLDTIDLLLMQSELDSSRIEAIGISYNKMKTVGNIKFDREWKPMDAVERDYWLNLLELSPESKIIVAGSTHEGEDEPILRTYKKLLALYPDLVLIIAPRKPEHVKKVESIANSIGLKIMKRTELKNNRQPGYNVLILDTIGELGRIYGLASVSFVGGSLVPIGGHNLLEPASFGCPVLFGKHTHNFALMSELLLEYNGGKRIKNPEDLYLTLEELLSDPDKSEKIGRNALNFVHSNSGALKRIMDFIGGDIASS